MERTFVIIKPNAMKKQVVGQIIDRFERENLRVLAIKISLISKELCKTFYEEHKDRPFFNELVEFMTSCPVTLLALEGKDACSRVREIMGATDPSSAKEGTLRKQYGDSVGENAVHGSDSLASAERELNLFFDKKELSV